MLYIEVVFLTEGISTIHNKKHIKGKKNVKIIKKNHKNNIVTIENLNYDFDNSGEFKYNKEKLVALKYIFFNTVLTESQCCAN